MHIFVLVLLGLTGLVMWVLMDESLVVSDVVTAIRVSSQKSTVMAGIVTLIIFALPILFSYIIRFDFYYIKNNPKCFIIIMYVYMIFVGLKSITIPGHRFILPYYGHSH